MRRLLILAAPAVLVGVLVATGMPSFANAGRELRASLSGYEEVPAVSTAASGSFRVRINPGDERVDWTLTYAGLEAPTTQAHIHFGARHTSGGITVWLCGNVGNTPAGVQACANGSDTISGTITPDDVVGPAGQGITAGQMAELVAAMRAGVTYANVHSSTFPAGEIRGQIDEGNSGASR